jgi:hypothetical protein
MASVVSGRVTFANGLSAAGVQVRVFDKDAPGKGDDDLTLVQGVSDSSGRFQVEYDPGGYMDFATLPFIGLRGGGLRVPDPLDILSPYLRFTWTEGGQEQVHTVGLELFHDQFKLPEAPELNFLPSRDGLHFVNAFTGYMLPFSVPFLSDAKVKGPYGLCGGMSAAAADFKLSRRQVPVDKEPPKRGTSLHQYLFRRSMDSFAMGESILRFARWMLLPDDGANGTYRLTLGEWDKVRAALDANCLVPIGQLRAKAGNIQEVSRDVWNNHQVLAYAYTQTAVGVWDIRIYDPNCKDDDSVVIHAEKIQVGTEKDQPVYGLACYESDCWEKQRKLHGFFAMPYEPLEPPAALSK